MTVTLDCEYEGSLKSFSQLQKIIACPVINTKLAATSIANSIEVINFTVLVTFTQFDCHC